MPGRNSKTQPTPFTEGLSAAVRGEITRATAGLGNAAAALVVHILLSALQHPTSSAGWIPLPASYLRTYFRRVVIQEPVRLGILECDRYFVRGERSRRYRIAPAFLERLAQVAVEGVTDRSAPLDPATGQRFKVRRSLRRDANDKLWPPLVLVGMAAVSECVYDRTALETALAAAADRAAATDDSAERARAFARLHNDTRVYAAVLRQRPKEGPDGLWHYPPAYAPQRTGRVTERGGGLQAISRPMRAAAFASTGALDFDLVASHPSITASLMETLGMETEWLRRWAGDRAWRDVLAAEVGLDVDVLKTGVLALVSGAALPTLAQANVARVRSTLVQALREAATVVPAGGTEAGDAYVAADRLADVHDAAIRALRPLADEIAPWHAHVRRHYLKQGAAGLEVHGSRVFVRNATGARYYPWEESRQGSNRLPSLLAHLLQGAEAAVIHRLAVLGELHGYRVWLNLHDGCVTTGNIPEAAFETAMSQAGLHGLRLTVKPFEVS